MRTRGILLIRDAMVVLGVYPSQSKLRVVRSELKPRSNSHSSHAAGGLAHPLRQFDWPTSGAHGRATEASRVVRFHRR